MTGHKIHCWLKTSKISYENTKNTKIWSHLKSLTVFGINWQQTMLSIGTLLLFLLILIFCVRFGDPILLKSFLFWDIKYIEILWEFWLSFRFISLFLPFYSYSCLEDWHSRIAINSNTGSTLIIISKENERTFSSLWTRCQTRAKEHILVCDGFWPHFLYSKPLPIASPLTHPTRRHTECTCRHVMMNRIQASNHAVHWCRIPSVMSSSKLI